MAWLRTLLVILCGLTLLADVASAAWKAGAAKIRITPDKAIWMAGYGSRDHPAEDTAQELYAKALVLEDERGRRAVLLTTDMLGFPRELAGRVTRRLEQEHGFERDRVLLNSSHTHAGPAVGRMLAAAYPKMTAAHWSEVAGYTAELEDKLVRVSTEALKKLAPAEVSFGRTRAGFAVNRRLKTPAGYRGGSVNWEGPVDHDVPILRVKSQTGALLAVVFGYACHNTAIGGDYYKFHGGWSGAAQHVLEEQLPGAVALFVAGCGADINPYPRPGVEFADMHGKAMATMVSRAIKRPLQSVDGPLRTAYEEFPLDFAKPPSRKDFEEMLREGNAYRKFHAREMLKTLDRDGRLPGSYPYPVQVWRFGDDLTLIALGGEVVVDYALRLKRELGAEKLWVAGYSNHMPGYIPSLRVLTEGGYEASGAMIYYMRPGPFTPSVEETIIAKVHQLLARTR